MSASNFNFTSNFGSVCPVTTCTAGICHTKNIFHNPIAQLGQVVVRTALEGILLVSLTSG
jgi:hypothetical protein